VLLSETSSSSSVFSASAEASTPLSSSWSSTADMYGSSVSGLFTITTDTSALGATCGVMGVLDSSSLASTKTSSALWLSFENLRDLVLFCDLLADTGVEPTTRGLFRAAGPVSRSGFRDCLATLGDSNRAERLSSEARADGVFSASCLCNVSWPGESKKSVAFFRVVGILDKQS
jgi:hypothetical protein